MQFDMKHNIVRVKKYLLVNLLSVLFVIMILSPIQMVKAGPSADYGDAPDDTLNPGNVYAYPGVVAKFPSLYDTANTRILGRRGPYHTSTEEEWLGPLNFSNPVSTTTKEADAKIVDLDEDDCSPQIGFNRGVPPLPPPWPAAVFFRVSVAPGAPDVDRYVHVLVDQNRNGSWEGLVGYSSEVIAVNRRIRISPNSSQVIGIAFGLVNTAPLWTRIILTRDTVDISIFQNVGGWDGSAPATGFGYGETEDWLLTPSEPPTFKALRVRQIPRPVWVPNLPGTPPRSDVQPFTVQVFLTNVVAGVPAPALVSVSVGGATFVWGDPGAIPWVAPRAGGVGVGVPPWLGGPAVLPIAVVSAGVCLPNVWNNFNFDAWFQRDADHRGTGWNWVIGAWDPPEEEYEPLFPPEEDGGIEQPATVGGVWVPVDKFGLLAPYIGLASTIIVATVATAICLRRVKRRKEKQ